MRTGELMPCPFCGGEVELVDNGIEGLFTDWGVVCERCNVFMISPSEDPDCVTTKEQAIDAWNRRNG